MDKLITRAFEFANIKKALDFLYSHLSRKYKADHLKFYLLSSNQSFLIPRYLYGTNLNLGVVSVHEGKSLIVDCYRKNQEIWIQDIINSDHCNNKLFKKQGINSFLSIPFLNQGVLTVQFKQLFKGDIKQVQIECKAFLNIILNRLYFKMIKEEIRSTEEDLKEQIAFSHKLSSLGKLASSLAHEIKNPLATVNMLIHQLLVDIDKNDLIYNDLSIILEEIKRINRLLAHFLEFAKPKAPDFKIVDLEYILKKTRNIIRAHMRNKKIDFIIHLEDSPLIEADPDQLQQIFLNLILNAVDVVKEREGVIEIIGGKDLKLGSKYYVIKFKDNGPGIPIEKLQHIFEPFFTEKGSSGVGLGLSIVHRLVENHQGMIKAYNLLNGGACFELFLPIQ